MNIIIPIGGSGGRFFPEYETPKPLIEVDGKPMVVTVIENLHIEHDDTLYIAYQKSLDIYYFQNMVAGFFPNTDIRFVVLDGTTKGAPDTLRRVLLTMSVSDLESPVVSVDCDTIYREDVLDILKKNAYGQDAVLYFITDEPEPIYSYVLLVDGKVTQIKEKVRISCNACSGAYKFAAGKELLEHIDIMYNVEKTSNEKYTSAVYAQLLTYGMSVYGYQISGINHVGTPEQLTKYKEKIDGYDERADRADT